MLPLSGIGASQLAEVGGKGGCNLAELLRGGFAFPSGFCLTTPAYVDATDRKRCCADVHDGARR